MSDINHMQFAMSNMLFPHVDPYGQYQLKEEKPSTMVIPSSWAALQQAATMATKTVTPPQRRKANPVPTEHKDEAYFERRKKNNYSAKRSRENRRQREQEYQFKYEMMLQENKQLKDYINQLQAQIFQFHQMAQQKQWPSTVLS